MLVIFAAKTKGSVKEFFPPRLHHNQYQRSKRFQEGMLPDPPSMLRFCVAFKSPALFNILDLPLIIPVLTHSYLEIEFTSGGGCAVKSDWE